MLPAQRAANAARSSHKEGGFGASVRHSIATAATPKPSAAPGGGSDHIVNRTTSARVRLSAIHRMAALFDRIHERRERGRPLSQENKPGQNQHGNDQRRQPILFFLPQESEPLPEKATHAFSYTPTKPKAASGFSSRLRPRAHLTFVALVPHSGPKRRCRADGTNCWAAPQSGAALQSLSVQWERALNAKRLGVLRDSAALFLKQAPWPNQKSFVSHPRIKSGF